jgi:hypothetical protein
MPNKQSRKQSTRRPRRKASSGTTPSSAINVWSNSSPKMEIKFFDTRWSNQQLYHNIGAKWNNTVNMLDLISNGNTVFTRIGASIFVKGLDFRLVLNNKTDRPNVSYRVVVVATPATSSADSFDEIVGGGAFTGTHVPIQSVILHDATFPNNQGSGMENNVTPNKERSFNHSAYIPINRAVTYGTDNGCQTRIVGYIIPYDSYGTLTTDNIASLAQASWRIDFVDP